MITRRDLLKHGAFAGAALSVPSKLVEALQQGQLITRAIPGSGEQLPVIGLGSSATFSRVARTEDVTALRAVLRALVDHGGSIFDTAPGYGASEEVAAGIVNELGVRDRVFWATKVNVAGRGGSAADPAEARAQIERSFTRLASPQIDLIQVHNLGDVPTQLALLKELKSEGRVKYIGVTTTSANQYSEIAQIMRTEPLDFIGIDYAVDNRESAETVLPLAQDRGIAVLIYAPFGRTRLWSRVAGQDVPDWAREFDASTWAQFFLKYVIAHPAVTAATPSTSKAENMIDNIGGGVGRLPDAATLRRMEQLVDALPPAPSRR
jgi:aryl-alcohol dehydrogenase-like predicted oxidoreductase